MVRDALSDVLVRLKNAQAVKKEATLLPYSSLAWETVKILEREGYLSKIERRGKRVRRTIEAGLLYNHDGSARITGARRVSKESKRVYRKASELYPVKHGYGLQVISTSKGLMTNKEAKAAKIGGEVLFEIW